MAPSDAHAVGVDRLSVTFPVAGYPPRALFDEATESLSRGTWRNVSRLRDERGRSVHLSVSRVGDAGIWARVEANPARLADPEGCSLLPLQWARTAAESMILAAAEFGVLPGCDWTDARVTRVDVARDFRGVVCPSAFVDGLRSVPRPYARRAGVWSDAQRGGAQTLHVGSGAGMVRLYDQHAAYAEKGAPEGSLRFEVEARKGWLRDRGVERVVDLTPGILGNVLADRWEWGRMEQPVVSRRRAVELLDQAVARGDFTRAQARSYLGALERQACGAGTGYSSRQAKRFRAGMRVSGIGALWVDDRVEAHTWGSRLDFALGTEVAA